MADMFVQSPSHIRHVPPVFGAFLAIAFTLIWLVAIFQNFRFYGWKARRGQIIALCVNLSMFLGEAVWLCGCGAFGLCDGSFKSRDA